MLRFLFFLLMWKDSEKKIPVFINSKERESAYLLCFCLLFVLIMVLMGCYILGRIFPESLFCNVTIRVSQKCYTGTAVL